MCSQYRINRFGIGAGVGAAILVAIGTGAVLALAPDAAAFPRDLTPCRQRPIVKGAECRGAAAERLEGRACVRVGYAC